MDAVRVLVVDDHPVVREGLCNLLRHVPDIEVVGEAGDGRQALQIVEKVRPDIVLLDVIMPGPGGVEVTRRIKKMYPDTAVVILSAHEDDRYILGLLEAGASGYLLKTSTGKEVIQALRAVGAGESVLHPHVAARVLARAIRAPVPAASFMERGLTMREMEVLKLAARGMSNKEIASELSLRVPTVKSHLVTVFTKIGACSRTEAILEALRRGWISLEDEDSEEQGREPHVVKLTA
jgi:DNA-binding NarL/FixJ family response regulator